MDVGNPGSAADSLNRKVADIALTAMNLNGIRRQPLPGKHAQGVLDKRLLIAQ